MKTIFYLALFILSVQSCHKDRIEKIRNKTCNCFDSIKFDGDKLKFQMAEQRGVTQLYNDILSIQTYYPKKSITELRQILYSELKEKCDSWNKVMTLYFQLSKQKTPSKLKDKTKCDIMKKGYYKDLIEENSYFEMNDSISIAKNNDFYTKSKIKWVDSCTYQVLPFESTDSIIKSRLSENLIFTITIIDIIGDTIIYENEYKNDYSLGQFIRLN